MDAFGARYRDLGVVTRDVRDECYAFSDEKHQYQMVEEGELGTPKND